MPVLEQVGALLHGAAHPDHRHRVDRRDAQRHPHFAPSGPPFQPASNDRRHGGQHQDEHGGRQKVVFPQQFGQRSRKPQRGIDRDDDRQCAEPEAPFPPGGEEGVVTGLGVRHGVRSVRFSALPMLLSGPLSSLSHGDHCFIIVSSVNHHYFIIVPRYMTEKELVPCASAS